MLNIELVMRICAHDIDLDNSVDYFDDTNPCSLFLTKPLLFPTIASNQRCALVNKLKCRYYMSVTVQNFVYHI